MHLPILMSLNFLNACAYKTQFCSAFQKKPKLFHREQSLCGYIPHKEIAHKKEIQQNLNIKGIQRIQGFFFLQLITVLMQLTILNAGAYKTKFCSATKKNQNDKRKISSCERTIPPIDILITKSLVNFCSTLSTFRGIKI